MAETIEREPITLSIERVSLCPVCDSDRFTIGPMFPYGGGYIQYSTCLRCGLMFLNPRMTDAQTQIYYSGTYRFMTAGETGIDPVDLDRQEKRAKVQAAAFKPFGPVDSHLEIGCSAGYLLHAIGALYSVGIEPDMRYHVIHPANQYTMYTRLDELVGIRFDLISMSHSLEHMNHPRDYMLDLLDKHAHDDTKVLIEVPNVEGATGVLSIHHPIAFSATTLFGLFKRLGYKLAAAFYHGLTEEENPPPLYILAVFEKESHA